MVKLVTILALTGIVAVANGASNSDSFSVGANQDRLYARGDKETAKAQDRDENVNKEGRDTSKTQQAQQAPFAQYAPYSPWAGYAPNYPYAPFNPYRAYGSFGQQVNRESADVNVPNAPVINAAGFGPGFGGQFANNFGPQFGGPMGGFGGPGFGGPGFGGPGFGGRAGPMGRGF